LLAKGVGENDIGELLAEGFGHEGHDCRRRGQLSRPCLFGKCVIF
jgi:hypothetical protein